MTQNERNRAIAERFSALFSPPLPVAPYLKRSGVEQKDGWSASGMRRVRGGRAGFICHVHGRGRWYIHTEAAGVEDEGLDSAFSAAARMTGRS